MRCGKKTSPEVLNEADTVFIFMPLISVFMSLMAGKVFIWNVLAEKDLVSFRSRSRPQNPLVLMENSLSIDKRERSTLASLK